MTTITHKHTSKELEREKTISKEVLEQSSISLKNRISLSQQISKPRTRAQLRSSLMLSK